LDKDNRYTFDHIIPKTAEGTYYTVPFTVPSGLERITVSYEYPRFRKSPSYATRKKNIVDLGLTDGSGRFLGWSGSARHSVSVGPYASTNGYLMTEIEPGDWQIIVGAYRIPENGITVRYEIEYTPKSPRWLVGDLHIHSNASDGQHDIYTLIKKAKKHHLDFIAVANHNNYSENLVLPTVPELTLLPAVEWTHYRGHMNFFGVCAPFDNTFIANNEEEMLSLIADAKAKGALVSVNHPKCGLCPYLWKSITCFDMVEVWNGPMRGDNMKAIAFWHGLLMDGRKVPLVGGSDFHKDIHVVRLARPVTRVYAKSPATGDMLEAISHGHSYVTASVNGITLDMRCQDAMMGDAVAWSEGLELSVNASRLRSGIKLKLVTSEGVAAEWKRFPGGKLSVKIPVDASWRFAYLIAIRKILGREYARAISNPIYFE